MLRFRCPACKKAETELSSLEGPGWKCPDCGSSWSGTAQVIRALAPGAEERNRGFLHDRELVLKAQGQGREEPEDYLELPYRPSDRRWRNCAATWRYFESQILGPLEKAAERPLSVLDMGAGVGWLSYRLALRGHRPVAIDLLADPHDGLGAVRHYAAKLEARFPAIQAEMDNVPLADDQFDLIVFNASFHCAVDYHETLREARRLLGWGGRVAILDTPVFPSFQQGEQMVAERQASFADRYGKPSASLLSMEYLDEGMLRALERELNIRWAIHKPWGGWRALLSRWGSRRPSARNWLLVGDWIGS